MYLNSLDVKLLHVYQASRFWSLDNISTSNQSQQLEITDVNFVAFPTYAITPCCQERDVYTINSNTDSTYLKRC